MVYFVVKCSNGGHLPASELPVGTEATVYRANIQRKISLLYFHCRFRPAVARVALHFSLKNNDTVEVFRWRSVAKHSMVRTLLLFLPSDNVA